MKAIAVAAAAAVVIFCNAAGQVASVYLTANPLSLYGLAVFVITGLLLVATILLGLVALACRDWSVLYLDDRPEQRRLRLPGSSGGWTQASMMVALTLNNAAGALLQWYATPPNRTPPLLQTIMPSFSVAAAVPLSKWLLGDKKRYWSVEPVLGAALICCSIIVSLVPSITGGDAGTGAETTTDTIAWAGMFLLSQVPTAAAFVGQQLWLTRAGGADPASSGLDKQICVLRMLMYNQIGVATWIGALFWLDILPWFGSSSSLAEFASGAAFSFSCVWTGTGDSSAGSCAPTAPLWGAVFLVTYVAYLIGVAVISTDSGVLNTLLSILSTAALTSFWLIPGMNPDPADTPVWSAVTSLLLSLAGVVVWKRWEAKTPVEEQFAIEPLPAAVFRGDLSWNRLLNKRKLSDNSDTHGVEQEMPVTSAYSLNSASGHGSGAAMHRAMEQELEDGAHTPLLAPQPPAHADGSTTSQFKL